MKPTDYLGIYLLIGMVYTFINVQFRDMSDSAENPFLVYAWIFIWPLFFILILSKQFRKICQNIKSVWISRKQVK